jgi:hypothetical protein
VGLVQAGAAEPDDRGPYRLEIAGQHRVFRTLPERIGNVRVQSREPIDRQDLGRLYLVEVRRPVELPPPAVGPSQVTAGPDEDSAGD